MPVVAELQGAVQITCNVQFQQSLIIRCHRIRWNFVANRGTTLHSHKPDCFIAPYPESFEMELSFYFYPERKSG
jgi:hypothetical protein